MDPMITPDNRVPRVSRRWPVALAWLGLFLVIAAFLPLFVCMPPHCDSTFTDLCARAILRGEVVYREI
jgi:hypothetical protein